jgi:hypothetical protein
MIQRAIVLPILFSVISLVAILPNPAEAVQVRVDFTTKVDLVQNQGVIGISPNIGDVATGFFTFDTTTPDENLTDPTRGVYHSGSMSVTIDGVTFTNDALPELSVASFPSPPAPSPGYLFGVTAGSGASQPDILVDGVQLAGAQIAFNFFEPPPAGTASDSLPFPWPAGLVVQQFSIIGPITDPFNQPIIEFSSFPSISVTPAPEPSTLILAALGGVALLMMRRRR